MLVPILLGLGAAAIVYAENQQKTDATPPKTKDKKVAAKPEKTETAAEAHARGITETEAIWKEKTNKSRIKHKTEMNTLKDLLTSKKSKKVEETDEENE